MKWRCFMEMKQFIDGTCNFFNEQLQTFEYVYSLTTVEEGTDIDEPTTTEPGNNEEATP